MDSESDRLYQMMGELRDSVEGYRRDLNGRLRRLEASEAHRQGAEHGKGSVARLVAGTAALAAAIAGVITATLNYV